MTKLGVIADSHRSRTNIRRALEKMGDCQLILHLGDHDSDMDAFGLPENRLLSVPGNCDPLSFAPGLRIFERDGVRVLMTHGDAYGVKFSLIRLALKAKEAGAHLALYGHSHVQRADDDGEVLCLNPGALKNGAYAIVTLNKGKVGYEFHRLA